MTDTELMFAVAAGDESAKAAIIERHRGPIMQAIDIANPRTSQLRSRQGRVPSAIET